MSQKHSNVFYVLTEEKGFVAEKNAIPVPNRAGVDLFRIGFYLSEGKTGRRIGPHETEEAMNAQIKRIETDKEYQDTLEKRIAEIVEGGSLSPRYTRSDEKYEELFPLRPARKSKQPKADRKSVTAAERQAEKARYETAVSNAGKSIYDKQSVINTEVGDAPIILCLFRENSVAIPRKMKDWIISSLMSVSFDESHFKWAFQHNGGLDPAFRGFFDQLVIALDRKHGGIQLAGIPS
jgi:hypothetical protein